MNESLAYIIHLLRRFAQKPFVDCLKRLPVKSVLNTIQISVNRLQTFVVITEKSTTSATQIDESFHKLCVE